MSEQQTFSPMAELLAAITPNNQPTTVEEAVHLLTLCTAAIEKMTIVHANVQFSTTSSRLIYFKETLPQLFGYCLYAQRTLDLHLFKPTGPPSRILNYMEANLASIENTRRLNSKIYRYYRLGQCDKDGELFTLSINDIGTPSPPTWAQPFLPLPSGTVPFAQIFADNLTADWIIQQMELAHLRFKKESNSDLKWTGTQAALTELIYALNEMGVLNGTRHEIQKLKIFFEKAFNTNLGNIYKTYEHNRLRKKSRTPFIDGLKAALLRRMDDDDLNAL